MKEKGAGSQSDRRRRVDTDAGEAHLWLGDGARDHEPRDVRGPQKLLWQGNGFFPGASGKNTALDFHFIRLISDVTSSLASPLAAAR